MTREHMETLLFSRFAPEVANLQQPGPEALLQAELRGFPCFSYRLPSFSDTKVLSNWKDTPVVKEAGEMTLLD